MNNEEVLVSEYEDIVTIVCPAHQFWDIIRTMSPLDTHAAAFSDRAPSKLIVVFGKGAGTEMKIILPPLTTLERIHKLGQVA